MLEIREQFILLELLKNEKLQNKELINLSLKETKVFESDKDYFAVVRRLEKWGLIHGSKFWHLTFKGNIRAKLIALDKNNPKNYRKNKKDVVLFEI